MGACGSKGAGQADQPDPKTEKQASLKQKKEEAPPAEPVADAPAAEPAADAPAAEGEVRQPP